MIVTSEYVRKLKFTFDLCKLKLRYLIHVNLNHVIL